MKTDQKPIPLASVVMFPPWFRTFTIGIGTAGVLMAIVTVIAVATGAVEPPQGERLAGMLVTLGASLFAFFLAWALPRARIRPQNLFLHIRKRAPASRPPSRARGLLILFAIAALVVGTAGTCYGWGSRQMAMTVVNSLLLVAIVGSLGAVTRHLHRQAIAVFAVYAEGSLDPADAHAIDAARAADPAFDAAVRDYLRINALVVEQVRSLS